MHFMSTHKYVKTDPGQREKETMMRSRKLGGLVLVFGMLAVCLIVASQTVASAEGQAAQADLPLFTEVTESAGVGWTDGEPKLGWGANWGDFNADGFPDLLAGRHFDIPGLFRNNGDGTFTDIVATTPMTEAGDPHGAAWGDYDNDGDQDLLQSVGGRAGHGPNPQKLYRSDGDGVFVDVAVEAGVDDPLARGRSVSWADYDRDGDLDFFQANSIREDSPNRLWRNNGDGTFTNVAAEAGVEIAIGSTGGSFMDYDVDGWPDIYVVHAGGAFVYHNNGDGTFEDVSAQVGFAPAGTPNYAWGDYDADGDLDLFLGSSSDPWFDYYEWEGNNARLVGKAAGDEDGIDVEVGGDTLEFRLRIVDGVDCDNFACVHIGSGDVSPATNPFTAGVEAYGIPPYTPTLTTGYYIWRDEGTDQWHVRVSHRPDAGNFRHETLVTATVSISDVVPFDLEPPPPPGRALLWRNEGDGTFVEVTAEAQLDVGNDFQNPNWVDFDNDGWLDLFVIHRGNVAIGNAPNWLFHNNGDGTFDNVAALVGVEGTNEGAGQGSAWADYDRNGFLDLFTLNCGYGGPVRTDCGPEQLFRNEGNGNHWLHLHLVGRVSNREGFGAIVRLTAGGRTLVRAHNDGVERYTQDADRLHFGLGANTMVDSIVIDWPSGIHQVVTDVPADQELTVIEPHKVYLPLIRK
jgi:hypothetical protein